MIWYYFLFKSNYRYALLGLISAVAVLWYLWLESEQIIGAALPVATSGIVLLNIVLSFFAHDRNRFVTRFLITTSYFVVALAIYAIYSVSRGLR